MTLGELMGPEAKLPGPWRQVPIEGLTADSRAVKPGYLFAALPGSRTDGSRYIAEALQRGAAAILVPQGAGQARNGTPIVEDADPRRRLALIAARFFGAQPEVAVAVTGTNGKTSVASFVRQLWEQMGYRAASLGTVGVVGPQARKPLLTPRLTPWSFTASLPISPSPALPILPLRHRAMGSSSAASMAFGLPPAPSPTSRATISTITRASRPISKRSFACSASFCRLVPAPSSMWTPRPAKRSQLLPNRAALSVISVGRSGETLRLISAEQDGFGQRLVVEHQGGKETFRLPLVGAFQASNALVAAGLCMATGAKPETVLPLLANLRGARGRLDLAGTTRTGAPIFIDYAHTPDALAKALDALRPYVRQRLLVVFGCGGDRDKGKRPEMGAVAVDKSDVAIVTDDNPRSEEPAEIRREILAAAPGAMEVPGRGTAVAQAIAGLGEGDVLLIAGKGHETGQIVKGTIIPYSDHDAVDAALRGD